MMYGLNKCENQRDNIIFGEHNARAYKGGIRRFENLSLDKLEELINGNFIDTSDRQNAAPAVKEIYEFMKNTLRTPRTAMQSRLSAMTTASVWRASPKRAALIRHKNLRTLRSFSSMPTSLSLRRCIVGLIER
ncbi:MAG: hypothetical protein IJT47_01110 [Selenomonadaceae bacterium]|nr:hypothetical protein [Selenomonadaceae bacterium]